MARIDLIRDAQRPKMAARALFKGPQGSGKTWTILSVARYLSGEDGQTYLLDTERESSLTYADVFTFKHLPWRAPYDTAELTHTLAQLDQRVNENDVVIVDSLSHFWSGAGGILDIASGRVQGGWDKARPIQNALVEQLLAMRCHVIIGCRMKNTVQVSDGGKTIETIGLQITQDDALEYEMNIAVQMDMQHNCTVVKSRTTAVPVGRVFPGGMEKKLADDYAEWLAGGIPPANRDDVDRIVAIFGGIVDKEARASLKQAFIEAFGMPNSLPAVEVANAIDWLSEHGAPIEQGPAAANAEAPETPTGGTDRDPAPVTAPEASSPAQPETAAGGSSRFTRAELHANGLDKVAMLAALTAYGISPARESSTNRRLLIDALVADQTWPSAVVADAAPTQSEVTDTEQTPGASEGTPNE